MYQSRQESHDFCLDIQIEDQVLTQVNKFKYLDSAVTNNYRFDAEIDPRNSIASKDFGWQRNRMLFCKDFFIKTKCVVYRAIVLLIRSLGAETWTVFKVNVQRLQVFIML